MNAALAKLNDRINALSVRERVLIFAVALVAIVVLWDALLFSPVQGELKRERDTLQRLNTQLAQLDGQLSELAVKSRFDPDAENRASLAQLEQATQLIDKELQQKTLELITPTQMARVLEDFITKNRGLRLLKVESEEPVLAEGLLANSQDEGISEEPEDAPKVYKHGMVVELSGTYAGVLEYLQALETLPWRLFWDTTQIKVQDYPVAHIRIKVYTLSLHEGWIGV